MNILAIILIYIVMFVVIVIVFNPILKKIGLGRGSFGRIKKGMRGFDFKNHPFKSVGKVIIAGWLFGFCWSGMASGVLMGEESPVISPIAAFFFACALTDIFIYASKLVSIVGFFIIYFGFYYLELGMTKNLSYSIAVLIGIAVFGCYLFRKK